MLKAVAAAVSVAPSAVSLINYGVVQSRRRLLAGVGVSFSAIVISTYTADTLSFRLNRAMDSGAFATALSDIAGISIVSVTGYSSTASSNKNPESGTVNVQRSTAQYSSAQCSAVQYSTVQCSAVQHSAVQSRVVSCSVV